MLTAEQTIERIQWPTTTSPTLAYHALQQGVERVSLAPTGAVITQIGSVAIGDPIHPAGTLAESLSDAEVNHGITSYFQITTKTAGFLQSMNYHVRQMGIETIIELPFSIDGSGKADLRHARNRALKARIRVVEISASDYQTLANEIVRLNKVWLESRSVLRREFRFLARPYQSAFQAGERRFVAFQDERIVGLAAYDPFYQSGSVSGYFESVIRQYDHTMQGVRDFLTLCAMEKFSSEGVQKLSLGLSPFIISEPKNISDVALLLFSKFGSSIFNCHGLAFHKRRYRGLEIPVFYATKERFPLVSLYHICASSNIDPIKAVLTFVISKFIHHLSPLATKTQRPNRSVRIVSDSSLSSL